MQVFTWASIYFCEASPLEGKFFSIKITGQWVICGATTSNIRKLTVKTRKILAKVPQNK